MARVLITGCSSGIGRATAWEFAGRGQTVIASARRLDSLNGLDVAKKVQLDVDDDQSVRAAVDAAGEIDVLVNNAGWGMSGPLEKVPIERMRALLDTNVLGVLRMVQAVVPQMRKRSSGTIVNVSSIMGRISTPLHGPYAATKHAVEAMSEAMHFELGHFGIRTVIIEPGQIATSFDDNRDWFGVDEPPYDELHRQTATSGETQHPGPDIVAKAIANAVEMDEPPLRVPASPDAELVLATRTELDDAAFETATRSFLGLDW